MAVAAERKRFLDIPLASIVAIDWERVILVSLIVFAVVTRFGDLGYRAYNHDESIHTDWSWNLYTGRGYQHNPIYHGPLLYHLTALTFFLFGDNDVTGRLPNAVFGIVLVALPFFFRRWLGRKGWVAAAAMLLISPAVLYYSRFNRHDIYVEVFVVLLALVIWKYFEDRRETWLYAAAALLAFAFTAMETTFIFVAVFAMFLCGHFAFEYLRPRVHWRDAVLALFAAVLGIPFFGLFVAYRALRAFSREGDRDWEEIPSYNLSMVLGTLSLPLITPALIYALNPLWQRVTQTDFFPISAFTDVNTIVSITQSQPDVMLRMLSLTVAVILASALLGVWWNSRRWVICALLFWPIFIVLFTTVFTNGGGFFTGLHGSLGYWLSQQTVARGGQPSYYYLLVMLPEYEFLPYIVGIGTILWYWWRYRPSRLIVVLAWVLWIIVYYAVLRPFLISLAAGRSPDPATAGGIFEQLVVAFIAILVPLTLFATYDHDNPESGFPAFIFTWVVGVLVIFSWAGEKMPWLTIHLTIPLAFAAGLGVERLLSADWRALARRGAVWLGILMALAVALFVMLLVSPRPFQGVTLDQLSATNAFIVSLVLLIAVVGPALYWIGRRFNTNEIVRVSAVALVGVMVLLTIRFAWMAVYIQPDVAAETMIYAQGSHDDAIAMQEIDDVSRRLCSQIGGVRTQQIPCDNGTIKVAYDDDSSWPFVWYLRNYRNAQYYGASPGAPFDAVVVIVGPKNEEAVKPLLGNRYTKRTYKLIWWPLEGYKDLTSERVLDYIADPQQRADLFTAWFYHRYKESYSQWPYVHNFSFYVRKDVASLLWNYAPDIPQQPAAEDEYTTKFTTIRAARVIGNEGTGGGQFEYPRNVAIDAQGNLYVVDSENARIQKFDSSGKFLLMWGSKSPDNNPAPPPSTFSQPWGIAVDKDGNVYVSDTWNHRIQKFDANGKFITMWGSNGDTRGVAQTMPLQFYGPRAIATDAQGDVYVTDTGNKRVLKFSSNGEPLGQFGGVGSDNGQFQEPVGLAIDKEGNIYVADTWNQRIQKFDSNFTYLTQWPVAAWDTQTVVNKPFLAVDEHGNVFVTDPEGSRVIEFAPDGKLVKLWGTRGNDPASFNLPTGLTFDAQGSLYVADSGNHRIMVFSNP